MSIESNIRAYAKRCAEKQPEPTKPAQGHTPGQIAEALRTFIKSGSADGREEMRAAMLKLVPVFAAAPDLLEENNNLKHDYAIVSAQRNTYLELLRRALPMVAQLDTECGNEIETAIAKAEGRAE